MTKTPQADGVLTEREFALVRLMQERTGQNGRVISFVCLASSLIIGGGYQVWIYCYDHGDGVEWLLNGVITMILFFAMVIALCVLTVVGLIFAINGVVNSGQQAERIRAGIYVAAHVAIPVVLATYYGWRFW